MYVEKIMHFFCILEAVRIVLKGCEPYACYTNVTTSLFLLNTVIATSKQNDGSVSVKTEMTHFLSGSNALPSIFESR